MTRAEYSKYLKKKYRCYSVFWKGKKLSILLSDKQSQQYIQQELTANNITNVEFLFYEFSNYTNGGSAGIQHPTVIGKAGE